MIVVLAGEAMPSCRELVAALAWPCLEVYVVSGWGESLVLFSEGVHACAQSVRTCSRGSLVVYRS